MIPAHVPDEPPLTYADSFDVPVLFRNGPARKPRRQWRTSKHQPWAGSHGIPATDGWYVSTTTWREIIKAAIEVGRDVTPHLQNQPQYAHGEFVARVPRCTPTSARTPSSLSTPYEAPRASA
ncbi:hypothetical protein [Nonomuraea sp. B5E05]|uniref:hypothetical protein n=1 Tax=Nonomuraea sp. B5E05 TaxID=3153569 RepID=UPI0032616AFC